MNFQIVSTPYLIVFMIIIKEKLLLVLNYIYFDFKEADHQVLNYNCVSFCDNKKLSLLLFLSIIHDNVLLFPSVPRWTWRAHQTWLKSTKRDSSKWTRTDNKGIVKSTGAIQAQDKKKKNKQTKWCVNCNIFWRWTM